MAKHPYEELADAISSIVYGSEDGMYMFPLRAYCKNNVDPHKQGRVQIYCPSISGEKCPPLKDLLWASPCIPLGGSSNLSSFTVPEMGAKLWVIFEAGSLNFPLYIGQWPAQNELSEETYDSENSPAYDFIYHRNKIKIRTKRDQKELLIQFDENTTQALTSDSINIKRKDSVVNLSDNLISLSVGSTNITLTGDSISLSSGGSNIKINSSTIDLLSAVVNVKEILNVG